MTERKIIGYTVIENMIPAAIYAPVLGSVVTHAFILCKECGTAISPCGGPAYNAVCLRCFKITKE